MPAVGNRDAKSEIVKLMAAGFMLGNMVTARAAHPWGIGRPIVIGAGVAAAGGLTLGAWSAFATPWS